MSPVSPAPEEGAQPASPTASQHALQLGWTMAVLYGDISEPAPSRPRQLPTVHELPSGERKDLELKRLTHLLAVLADHPECQTVGLPKDLQLLPGPSGDKEQFRNGLEALNLRILTALASTNPSIELAYELGRSIRDTVNPPQNQASSPVDGLAHQLARSRVAQIQDWLATLSGQYPPYAASIVSASMGRWSELSELTISTSKSALKGAKSGARDTFALTMREYLLPQGDLWLTLLAGTLSTSGLLSPEGYVSAGEEALRRSVLIVRELLKKYRVALSIALIIVAGILYLTYIDLSGAARVWTYIAAIAGSIGLSAKSIMSSLGRMSASAERPLFSAAKEDAMAWAVTTMPQARLSPSGVRQMRRAGIAPSADLSRP